MTYRPHSLDPSWTVFAQKQRDRIAFRWRLLLCGVYLTAFWVLIATAFAWLSSYGLVVLAIPVLIMWCVAAVPAILMQLMLIADAFYYSAVRRSIFYPALLAAVQDGLDAAQLRSRRKRLYTRAIAHSSPFSILALWCAVVLARAPESAHVVSVDEYRRRFKKDNGQSGPTTTPTSRRIERVGGEYVEDVLRHEPAWA